MPGELTVGRDIQTRVLPSQFPALAHRAELDIHAAVHPGREVGGDFYDVFPIDEHRVGFAIGRVPGTGVAAAQCMAATQALLKARAGAGGSPAGILAQVNDALADGGDVAPGVTVWLGIVDLRDGAVTYTNAGHTPPCVRRADGSVECLAGRHGPAAGAAPGVVYGEGALRLRPGDAVLLYTPGVSEATDAHGACYGECRLVELLRTCATAAAEALVRATLEQVLQFQSGAEAADDVTVLAVSYRGAAPPGAPWSLHLTIGAELGQIATVTAALADFAAAHALPAKVRRSIDVALDELLTNTISYGLDGRTDGTIWVDVDLSRARLSVTLTDNGKPFNPFDAPSPDTTLSVQERAIGGLGIHLVRKLMDECLYHRRADRNVVTLAKVLADPAPQIS